MGPFYSVQREGEEANSKQCGIASAKIFIKTCLTENSITLVVYVGLWLCTQT